MDRYSTHQHHRNDPNDTYYSDYEEKIPEFSSRNDHFDGDQEEGESPVVEITLQCLGGIQCRQRASVTAQVSFSGSAKDMQVGSSMLCGRTGQLVVESQSFLLDEEEPGSVYWTQSPKQKPAAQPHLTIRLPPNQDPRVPNISLSKVNRNSRLVVKKDYETDDDEHDLNAVPSLQDESEDSGSTHSQDQPRLAKASGANAPDDGTVRGGSIIWSASGAGMPEIVELHVTLLAEDEVDDSDEDDEEDDRTSSASGVLSSPQQQGIAHLVFYGNDYGTFVLDLPVKKVYMPSTNPASPPPSPVSGMVWMNSDAYIRVQVSVSAPGRQRRRQELQEMMMRSTGSWVNNNHEDRWTTIIRQLQENEEQARRLRLQQLNPQYSLDELNVTQEEQEEKAQIIWEDGDEGLPRLFKSRGPSSRLFCPTADTNLGGGEGVGVGGGGGAARWMDAMVESFSRVASCQYPKRNPFPTMIVSRHRKATTTNISKTTKNRRKAVDTSSEYEWSIAETDTMVSTIATRDSLNI